MSKVGGQPVRTFLAVDLTPDVRSLLAGVQADLSAHAAMLKLVEPESLHVTLRFLGPVASGRLAAVDAVATESASSVEPFALTLSGLGMFPERGKLRRVVWVGFETNDGYAVLQRLFRSLEHGLIARGFPRERRAYAPHLTLARVRDGFPPEEHAGLATTVERLAGSRTAGVSFAVHALTVFRSDLSPRGPVYTPLLRAPLGRAA